MRVFLNRNAVLLLLFFIFSCAHLKEEALENTEPNPREIPHETIVVTHNMLPPEPPPEFNEKTDVEVDTVIIEKERERIAAEEADTVIAEVDTAITELALEQNDEEKIVLIEEAEVDEGKGQNLLDDALDFYKSSQDFWAEGNLEKAIDALDQAYSLVLEVDTDNSPEVIQQKEDLRFMISKRILEIYASRYTAVNGNHKAIPLTMNRHVENEIKQFQGPERDFFINSYKRSGKYREAIANSLKEAGLPEELSWLPLIESGFKVRALSRARALGLWQFIPSTGYKFGLKRDTWIDERLNPEKSTVAAIAYLKELHQMFGDWTTVLAAYNCGEGTVLKVIKEQKINYLDNFWDLYERLPLETARYVPRFLATLYILSEPDKYGFELTEIDEPVPYKIVMVNKPVQLKAIADKINVSLDELSDLNPELRHLATPNKPFPLKVPAGAEETLLARLDEVQEWIPAKSTYVYHRVKEGETLSVIALKYHTTVSRITAANNIRRKHFVRAGQKLKIPLGIGTSAVASASEELLPDGNYRVKKGDSFSVIAKKFNTTTKTLQHINNMQSSRLNVGQIIKVTEEKAFD